MSYMQHFPDLARRRAVTVEQLGWADEERRLRGTMLADELARAGLVPHQVLATTGSLDGFAFDPQVPGLAGAEVCLRHRFLFLSKWRGCTTTVVALVDPGNLEAVDQVTNAWFLGRFMEPVVVPEEALVRAIRTVHSPSWKPAPRPDNRPPDEALLPAIQRAARAHFAGKDRASNDAEQGVVDLFKEAGHTWSTPVRGGGKVPCAMCGNEPMSGFYVNVVAPRALRGERPVLVCTIGGPPAAPPALCHGCVSRDWKAWELDMAAVIGLLRGGGAPDRAAERELGRRFERRAIRVTAGKCDFCGARSDGVRGIAAFGCARCMEEARQVFLVAHRAMMKGMDDRKQREEEEKNRPFPAEDREAARRVARGLRARRESIYGVITREKGGAGSGAWDDVRRWFDESPTSYVYMRSFRERAEKSPPPPDVVDRVARGLTLLIESAALDGLRQRHKGMLSGAKDVVGERWPSQHAMSLLGSSPIDPAVREEMDTAMVLLRGVLQSGVRYFEWDDGYDEVTDGWVQLTTFLYDHRMALAGALQAGGLLLSGSTAEERQIVAYELHLARTGGFDAISGAPFVVIGRGPLEQPLTREMGPATVFVPRPLELSEEEQAYLFYRLNPSGPPQPTILGADDAATLYEGARDRLMEKLIPRLYRHEYDLRREMGGA